MVPEVDPVIGFYTTRIVVARNEQEAGEKGVEELLKEKEVQNFIRATRCSSNKEPVIEIEKIEEVSWLQSLKKYAGFSLYQHE